MRESIFKTHLENEEVIDNYDILKKLGNGAFGQVYLVRRKRSSALFALKEMDKARIAEEGLRRYVDAERYVLTQVTHPFLLHASFCLQDFTHLYILTDYCSGGDL
jgi:serine/threonine protein kinase